MEDQHAREPTDLRDSSSADDSGTVEVGALDAAVSASVRDGSGAFDATRVEAVDAGVTDASSPRSTADASLASSQPTESATPIDASDSDAVTPQASTSNVAPAPERRATCGESLSAEPIGVNGHVASSVRGEDGTRYVGGHFNIAGPVTGGGVPFNTVTGEPQVGFSKVAGVVYAVVADGAGGWFIGGEFTHVGTLPRGNLAHIAADHQVDATWTADTDDAVLALALDADTLYVGGEFTSLGGQPRHGLGALDFTANVTAWVPEPEQTAAGPNDPSDVRALLFDQGTLYVGGHFNQIAGQPRYNLASFTVGGILTSWEPVVSWPIFDSDVATVQAIASAGDHIYVGGHFQVVQGDTHNGIVRFDRDGDVSSWGPAFSDYSQVNAMAVANGVLYVGGSLGGPEEDPRVNLAAFDDAGELTDWVPQVDSRQVHALAVIDDTIYIAGEPPTPPGSINAASLGGTLAAVDVAGNRLSWEPFTDSIVHALGTQQDALYVGGEMRTMCGESRNYLAAIDAQGMLSPWNPKADFYVNALAIQDETLYAGGAFRQVNGQARSKLAAIDTAGVVTAWNPGVDSLGIVSALIVHGGYIAAGGYFSTVGGTLQKNLALFDTEGTVMPWDTSTTGDVYSLASLNDTLYVAGGFTEIGGQARAGLAALGPDGSVTDWMPEPDGTPFSVASAGDALYVGGEFTAIAGAARGAVAAFDAAGALLPWNPGTGFGSEPHVWRVAATASAAYLLGSFPDILGDDREGLIAVGTDGMLTPWDPAPNPGAGSITAADTEICVEGAFTFIAGQHVAGISCVAP